MTAWILWAGKGAVLAVLLAGASCSDIQSRKVPDYYSILILLTVLMPPFKAEWRGIFCALPFLAAALAAGGIGGADIKIMGAAGIVIGFWEGLAAMVIGLTGMLLFHLVRRLSGKGQARGQSYPLVPFLAAGIIFVYLTQMHVQ